MQQQSRETMADDAPQLYLCTVGEAAERQAPKLAEALREALPGLRLVLNAGGGKLKSQLGRAEKLGAALVVVLGEAEMARGAVQVKSATPSASPGPQGEGEAIAFADLAAHLAARLALSRSQALKS